MEAKHLENFLNNPRTELLFISLETAECIFKISPKPLFIILENNIHVLLNVIANLFIYKHGWSLHFLKEFFLSLYLACNFPCKNVGNEQKQIDRMYDKNLVKSIRKRGFGVSGNLVLHAWVCTREQTESRKCNVLYWKIEVCKTSHPLCIFSRWYPSLIHDIL